MPDTITVTSQIPVELGELLTRVAEAEERSKSYYVKKGLEIILRQRLDDIQDYDDAVAAHAAHLASGEAAISLDEAFAPE